MLRLSLLFCIVGSLFAQTPASVRFTTNLGIIDVQLLPDSAPKTVENFLKYMNKGAYNNSIIHRSVRNFIIQGGGFQAALPKPTAISADAAVVNEYKESNIRGTIAMAKLGDNPNSATNEWFFNLANNATILNGQNGGFTVFGRIVDNASLAVMDKIAAVRVYSPSPLDAPWDEIPLVDYTGTLQLSNYVTIQSVTQIATLPAPAIADGGVVSAGAFGGYNAAAPGSFLEIYGSNLSENTRSWELADFTNNAAPTALDGVSVTIGGQRAFVNYISPTQVNVQVPSTVIDDRPLPVVVTYKGQQTGQVYIDMKRFSGGLLAPAAYKIGGKQFVYAVHAATGVPVTAAAPAKPGETLLYYGTGFGPLTPFSIPYAGQIVKTLGTLGYPTEWKIGGSAATVAFQGLIPDLVGVYQFNVVVPPDSATGDLRLEVNQNGAPIGQTLYLPVQR